MKRFVSFNPNSPKKRRRKKPIKHGETLAFGSTGTALGLDSPITLSENHLQPILGSPWTPLPNFRTWESSRLSGPALSTAQNYEEPNRSPSTPPGPSPESPPILLTLSNSATDPGQSLEASDLHVYAPPSLSPPSAWGVCKRNVLKAIADAGRSPLDLILDILDPSQDEYELYRVRWFSTSCNKVPCLLDGIFAHSKGRNLVLNWMLPHSLESVCSMVASEMDLAVKELSLPSVEHVSTEFISKWTLESVIEPATLLCPSLLRILEAAAQTPEAKQKNKIKLPKTVQRNFSRLYGATKMGVDLQYSGRTARISTFESMCQVSSGLQSFSLEYRVIKKNN